MRDQQSPDSVNLHHISTARPDAEAMVVGSARSPTSAPAEIGRSERRSSRGHPKKDATLFKPTLSTLVCALCVTGVSAVVQPAYAVGAKCPASTASATITSQFQSGVLRCLRRTQATPICPPTHPMYRIMPEPSGQPPTDFCAPPNIIVPAPSQRARLICPPGMRLAINDVGRDSCRSDNTTQVAPLLIPD